MIKVVCLLQRDLADLYKMRFAKRVAYFVSNCVVVPVVDVFGIRFQQPKIYCVD